MAGFWQNLLSSVTGGSAVHSPRVEHLSADAFADWLRTNGDMSSMSAAKMWSTQPHFRTVVTFLARNTAQLGLHVFERDGESRKRDRSSPLARSIAGVDGTMTTFELVFALAGDLALYDRAYWWVAPSSEMTSGWMIRRLPPTWVDPVMADPWTVKHYRVWLGAGKTVTVPPEKILAFPGYHPGKMNGASPVVDALRDTLQEQVEAALYRGQVWKRGGRVSSVIERPKDAPGWSDGARESFREDWYAKFTGRGSRAGGTPILEDGMTLKRIDFNAQEQQFVEAAKLSLVTVASAFHVNPTMIGQNDGANYSNVREFRKALYTETLGPLLAQVEARINAFLVPMLGMDPATSYVEFNVSEKLQGNFEEQASVISASVGRPWMTADEARSRFNMPLLGGDAGQLVTPLNVLVGGQASSRDSGEQNRRSGPSPHVKARPERTQERAEQAIADFFARQGRSVRSAVGAGGDWWDGERWDGELSSTLAGLYLLTATTAGRATLDSLGIEPDEYDEPRTEAFLLEVARRSATGINDVTRQQVEAAIEADEDVAHVFEVAESSRAAGAAATVTTFAAGFGTVEAARQQSGDQATKTWNVNSSNPRSTHASMAGETVPIGDLFSNGMDFPGDSGDPDEVAGCECSVTMSFPD